MSARFIRDDVVHWGNCLEMEDGSHVYFLCERIRLVNALYGGPEHDRLSMYALDVEAFHTLDDVDCMTCLVMRARIGGSK